MYDHHPHDPKVPYNEGKREPVNDQVSNPQDLSAKGDIEHITSLLQNDLFFLAYIKYVAVTMKSKIPEATTNHT